MARLKEIVFDATHPARLARFWAAALEGYHVRAYDQVEIERLAGLGFTPETDPTVMVDGPGPSLCFQTFPGPARGRGAVHLDIVGMDLAREMQRLMTLGARVRVQHAGHAVMSDPEGNTFCVRAPRP